MCSCREWMVAASLAVSCGAQAEPPGFPGIGRPATAREIAAWDIDVRPDFKGLPPGSGSVAKGTDVWESKCASCHGVFGESNEVFSPIVGGTTREDVATGHAARLNDGSYPGRTTLMKLSTISTLWDYINRAMPWNAPKTLTADEVYALTAYILNQGGIVADDFVLSERNMAEAQKRLPNRNGMTRDHGLWDTKGRPDVRATACMNNCGPEPRVTSQLPAHARDSHGDLAAQNRLIGPVRGISLTTDAKPAAAPARADPAQALAEKSGCMSCHAVKQRVIGPSLAEIAAKYRADSSAESKLVSKVKSGGQGVWGNVPMPPFTQLQEQDLRTLVRWILNTE